MWQIIKDQGHEYSSRRRNEHLALLPPRPLVGLDRDLCDGGKAFGSEECAQQGNEVGAGGAQAQQQDRL